MSPGPAAAEPLAERLDDILTCVHCGFCLPACPTYEILGDENDSPRGRLYLMRAVAEGRLAPEDPSFARHLDRCLGCRACEPVCPSGVRYGLLLEHAREARRAAGGAVDRLGRLALKTLFASRWVQNLFWRSLRVLRATRLPLLVARAGRRRATPGRLRFALAMLAATAPGAARALVRAWGGGPPTAGAGAPGSAVGATPGRERVALLEGCVMAGLLGHVNRATERVVRAHGAGTVPLPAGFCCGALHAHAGELEAARRLARRIIVLFEKSGADRLLTNSAGCGAAMKAYPDWFADQPAFRARAERLAAAVRDVSEWLAARPGRPCRPLQARVGYDAPCHLLHAQRIDDAPVEVLARVPELDVVRLPRADRCCGAAGTYGLARRALSDRLLGRKLDEILDIDVDVVATGNPGCLMQIGAGAITRRLALTVVHPIELLDAALEPGAVAGG